MHSSFQDILFSFPVPSELLHRDILEHAQPRHLQDLIYRPLLLHRIRITPPTNPEPAKLDILEYQRRCGQLQRLLRHATIRNQVSRLRETPHQRRRRFPPHAIQPQSDLLPPSIRPLLNLFREPPIHELGLGNHLGRSQLHQLLPHLLRRQRIGPIPDDIDTLQPPLPRELDRGPAHAAIRAVLDDPVALDQRLEVLQHAVRRARVHGHGAHLRRRQAGPVDLEDLGLAGEGVRAPRPEPRGAHDDPVALGHGGDGRRDGEDFEAALVAADGAGRGRPQERGEGGLARVDALDLVYVGGVDGGCEGAEEEGVGGEGGGD